jgi:hypothetical protein
MIVFSLLCEVHNRSFENETSHNFEKRTTRINGTVKMTTDTAWVPSSTRQRIPKDLAPMPWN